MTTGSILLGLALLIIVVLFVARPFLLPRARPLQLSERQHLLDQKEALLAQIKALDFDAQTGKVPPKEHAAEREHLMQQATAVLEQLDETQDVEAEIEAAVRRLRAHQAPTETINFCPQCGAGVAAEDKFCANCGRALPTQEPPR